MKDILPPGAHLTGIGPRRGAEAAMANAHQKFEAMVNALSGDIYRYAVWLCRDRTMAEELVQETFLRAWKSLDSLRDETKAKSWLITTLRREYARQFERYRPQFADVELDSLAGAPDTAENHGAIAELRRAIGVLPQKYREPLVLQVIGGYSGDEIASLLGLGRPTVMTRLFRARGMLRKRMAGDEGALIEGVEAI